MNHGQTQGLGPSCTSRWRAWVTRQNRAREELHWSGLRRGFTKREREPRGCSPMAWKGGIVAEMVGRLRMAAAAANEAWSAGAPGRGCSPTMVGEVEWTPGTSFWPSLEVGRRWSRPASKDGGGGL
jgi:hypothetical protein